MYINPHIFTELIETPYNQGGRNLTILTGYASSAFLHHIVEKFPELNINVVIGMAKRDGINDWDHAEFMRLTHNLSRVNVYYYIGNPPIHSKIVFWNDMPEYCFVGSANFTWNGFRDQQEVMVKTVHDNIEDIIDVHPKILCTDEMYDTNIRFNFPLARITESGSLSLRSTKDFKRYKEFVDLSLKIQGKDEIHEKSGLNWGQRPGREPNQAYIPVPTEVHNQKPDFFPGLKEEFTIFTDDGKSFLCKMEQANRKAITTCRDNSELGRYFRLRLNVPFGQKVEVRDLNTYGRDFVRIYKIDSERFFMDFSINH